MPTLLRLLATTIILYSIPSECTAQDYLPFTAGEHARYECTTDPELPDEFFYSITDSTTDSTVVIQNYFGYQDFFSNEYFYECEFWGGPNGQLDTMWLGGSLDYSLDERTLTLLNREGEELLFDFSLTLSDTLPFYENDTLTAYMIFDGTYYEDVLGYPDSLKRYGLALYDQNDLPYDSPINGTSIEVGKELGIVSFIEVLDFPAIQAHYSLKGRSTPAIGQYMMTFDELYPWDVGDIIQYEGFQQSFQSQWRRTYQNITVIERIETLDSVFIHYDTEIITVDEVTAPDNPYPYQGQTITMPLPYPAIAYKKGEHFTPRPPGSVRAEDGAGLSEISEFPSECSYKLRFSPSYQRYCDSCSCFGGVDGFGSVVYRNSYESARGPSDRIYSYYGAGEETPTANIYMIYSNIGGQECGEFHVVGIEENDVRIGIRPNPASDQLTIQSKTPIEGITIIDPDGRSISTHVSGSGGQEVIPVDHLIPGSYVLLVRTSGIVVARRVLISR